MLGVAPELFGCDGWAVLPPTVLSPFCMSERPENQIKTSLWLLIREDVRVQSSAESLVTSQDHPHGTCLKLPSGPNPFGESSSASVYDRHLCNFFLSSLEGPLDGTSTNFVIAAFLGLDEERVFLPVTSRPIWR